MTSYSRVCSRIEGLATISYDAFFFRPIGGGPIDEAYLDGISVTHGSPRQHIWSFAAGVGLSFNGVHI